jgi:EAL domain-containing protein (putative c-di-GMP-specific phosphodiesterase class I)
MTSCTQCGVVPDAFPSEGTLVFAGLPETEAAALERALEPYGIALQCIDGGMRSTLLFAGSFEIVRDWSRLVSGRLLEEGHFIVLAPGEAISFSHMGKMRPLANLVKRVRNAWVLEMIRENRLTVHFQGIFNTQDPDRIFANECLMRGLAVKDELVSPGAILDAADEEGLVFHLDRLGRVNAIKAFAAQGVEGKAFINFNPVSVYNPLACLATTVAAAKASGLTPDRIVFELIERNHVADEAHLLRVVDFYRTAGYGVALDDVGAGYSGLNLLSALKPDYMKLDMNLIRNVDRDPVRQGVVANMLEMGRKLGILSIVEGVETEAEYEFARREGADFVQGYLFGRPQPAARQSELQPLSV